MNKRWEVQAGSEVRAGALRQACGISGPLAAVLAARCFADAAEVDRFLRPRLSDLGDPLDLPGMAAAVDRIWQALERGETVVVYGDYDVDGITSTALLSKVLEHLGGTVRTFLPHRVDDGYGLTAEPVERCVRDHSPGLTITVDCGTNSPEASRRARELGVDLIVTDHHEPAAERSEACAIVNPKLGTDPDLHKLAGVGVAFKLCHALLKVGRQRGIAAATALDIRPLLDLVAVGTVADVVPLSGENRRLTYHGLAALNQTANLGLKTLVEVAGVKGALEAYHIGFVLGPRLNAAGRLGAAAASLELLTTPDPARARKLALELDAVNRERRDTETAIYEEIADRLDSEFDPAQTSAIVVWKRGWHPGVIGIVAGRICRRYHRPAVVIGIDEEGVGKGSGRSIEGFDLVEGLSACSALLRTHGGHQMAAGLSIREEDAPAFAEAFSAFARSALRPEDLVPRVKIDARIELGDLGVPEVKELEAMQPFGIDNPRPVFASTGVAVLTSTIVGQNHLKLKLASGGSTLDAIGFGMGETVLPEGPIDVAYQPKIDTFGGRERVQLQLVDLRASDLSASHL